MGSGNSKEVYDQVERATCAGFHPPISFTLFVNNSIGRRAYSLGTEQTGPIYFFSVNRGDIIIHNGPTKDHPPLAAVDGGYGTKATIVLPPVEPGLPGFTSEFSLSYWSDNAYGFQVPVGRGPRKNVEKFEWRRSQGGEVASLGESFAGWKLVRGDSESHSEVLAAWSYASFSLSRAAEFRFVNIGATGELGDAFALMTILSFVKLYVRLAQARARARNGAQRRL